MKLSIYWKMMLGFATIIVLMTSVDAYILFEMYGVSRTAHTMLTMDVQTVDAAKQLKTALFDEERYAEKYLVSGDTTYRALFTEQAELFNQYLDSLTRHQQDPLVQRTVKEVDRQHTWHFNTVTGRAARQSTLSRAVELQARADTLGRMYDAFDYLVNVKQQQVAFSAQDAEEAAQRSADVSLLLTIGTALLAILLAVYIARTITRPLRLLVHGTEHVARGSFAQIDVNAGGEVGHLASAFNRMSDSLAKVNAARAEMMQHISHELRMPLQTMHSAYYLLTEQQAGPINSGQLKLLNSIKDNIEKIARFSNQFLDLSRIEAGMMEFELAPTDIIDLLTPLVEDAALNASSKGICMDFSKAPVPRVMVNAEKCSHIFTNLLSNAVKYTDKGGRVTVSVAQCNYGVRISVSDTGIGIAEEDLPRVFEKFFRARSAVSGHKKGTGIGLALVKALTEGQGGRISAASTLGVGSTFSVEFRQAEHPVEKLKEVAEA